MERVKGISEDDNGQSTIVDGNLDRARVTATRNNIQFYLTSIQIGSFLE